jgi:hypothetical protein
MEGKLAYTECELRYMDQGYDLERAVQTCAEVEGRSSEEKKEKSSQEEPWQDYWGDF